MLPALRTVAARQAPLARAYATAAPSQNVKVPVNLYGISGRYATALYTAGVKKNALEAVEKDLASLGALIQKDAGVATFLASPLSDRAQKNAGIDAILAQGRFSETTGHFLRLLADNRRLNATEGIIASFTEIMAAHRGEVSVTVTSATKLDNKAMTNLKNSIAKSALASGKKLIVDNVVDPAVLGGVVVTIGDRTIDLSVASRLAKLNRAVAEPI